MRALKKAALVLFLLFAAAPLEARANIILKVVATNPSPDEVQKVPIKAFLSREVKPEDIIEKGDLEVQYDTQVGTYCVYGEYELKPGEVVERDVEIRDVWVISSFELDALRQETRDIVETLKNSEFRQRVGFLQNSINTKLDQIVQSQVNSPANPEQHISAYRENLKLFDSVKADMVLARSLLSQSRPVSKAMVWRVFLGIIIFLGVLGLSFYLIWFRQVKILTQENSIMASPKATSTPVDSDPKRHEFDDKKS